MKRLLCTLALFALVAGPLSARAEQSDLDQLELGSHVAGPKPTAQQVRGKVVMVLYWGTADADSLKYIAFTTELAKQYAGQGVVVAAINLTSDTNANVKAVWAKHAKNDLVAVANRAPARPGVRPFQVRGLPRVTIYDTKGKAVWIQHPGRMDRALPAVIKGEPIPTLADEMAALEPVRKPIVTGIKPEYFKREVEQINKQDRHLPLRRLRQAVERGDADQAAEAKAILAIIEPWAKKRRAAVDAAFKRDPIQGYFMAEDLTNLIGSDELGKPVWTYITKVESDEKLSTEMQATRVLNSARTLAKLTGLAKDPAAAKKNPNPHTLEIIDKRIASLLQEVKRNYQDTDAAKQAEALRKKWGLKQAP